MKKSELKSGMIVDLANGESYVAMVDTCIDGYNEGFLLHIGQRGYLDLEHYDNDLKCYDPVFTVIRVRKPEYPCDITTNYGEVIWEKEGLKAT